MWRAYATAVCACRALRSCTKHTARRTISETASGSNGVSRQSKAPYARAAWRSSGSFEPATTIEQTGAGATSARFKASIHVPSGSFVSVNIRCGWVCSSNCAALAQLPTLKVSMPSPFKICLSASQGSALSWIIKANTWLGKVFLPIRRVSFPCILRTQNSSAKVGEQDWMDTDFQTSKQVPWAGASSAPLVLVIPG